MPYCAPSVNGAQCQAYSCEPSARGSGLPAQPGISSLVCRGLRSGFTSLNLTSCIVPSGVNCRATYAMNVPRPKPTIPARGQEFHPPAGLPLRLTARIGHPVYSALKAAITSPTRTWAATVDAANEVMREAHVLSRRAFAGALLGTAFIPARAALAADSYPSRPIRVISPYPAGSASDTVGRVVLDKVSQILGQAMVVEPKPGAGGIVGFADVAKATPDGYTLVTSSTSMGTGLVLHRHLPYDPAKDFESVAMLGV